MSLRERHLRDILMIAGRLGTCFAMCAALQIGLVPRIFAQTPGTGALRGVVYDPAGRSIADADVVATNEATNLSRAARTTDDGVFRVPLLPPGSYAVIVKAAGFADRTVKSIAVTVSETSSLNVTLQVAAAKASVEVEAGAEVVQTESSTLGRAVEQESIEALPLANR